MLADVFLQGYDFLLHSSAVIAEDDITVAIAASRANTDPRPGVPFFTLNTVGVSNADDREDLIADYEEHGSSLFHGTAVTRFIAGRRTDITITTGTYRNEVIRLPSGLAPGTKVLPIRVFGPVSLNICKVGTPGSCTRQRPHLARDGAIAPRLSVVASLAWKHNAFAVNGSLGPGGQTGFKVTVVSRQAHRVTLTAQRFIDGRPLPDGMSLPTIIVAGKITIDEGFPILFTPLALTPEQLAEKGEITVLPQAAQDLITGKNGGDGIAFVFASGNNGLHDGENAVYYRRDPDLRYPVELEGVYRVTISGSQRDVLYGGMSAEVVSLTIANGNLDTPLHNNQNIRDFGLTTVTIDWIDSDGSRQQTEHFTRSVVGYFGGLWRLPGNDDLEDYWLLVAASQNITVGGVVTPTIAVYSNGCGVAWKRCITAPGSGIAAYNDVTDAAAARFSYGDGTSFAAPYVTGALALLKKHFPDLRADAATGILLDTADDLGPEGPDPIYGMGHLNVARALQPVGALTSRSLGAGVPLAGSHWSLSAPLAAAAQAAGQITGYDRYSRPFYLSLGSLMKGGDLPRPPSAARREVAGLERSTRTAGRYDFGYDGGRLQRLAFAPAAGLRLSHDFCPRECLHSGDAWGFMPAHLQLGSISRLHKEILADDLLAFEAAVAAGRTTGARWRQLALRTAGSPAAGLQLAAEGGLIGESDTLLGSEPGGGFALLRGASTRFAHVAGALQLAPDVQGYGSYALSWTRAQVPADGLLVGISDLRADALRLGVRRDNLLRAGDGVRLEVSQPLRVRSGKLAFFAGGYETGRPVTGRFEVDLGEAERERVWTLSYFAPAIWLGMRGYLAAGLEHSRGVSPFATGGDRLSYSLDISLHM